MLIQFIECQIRMRNVRVRNLYRMSQSGNDTHLLDEKDEFLEVHDERFPNLLIR